MHRTGILIAAVAVATILSAGAALAATVNCVPGEPCGGTNEADTLNGTPVRDAISGYAGDDALNGNGGADYLYGGMGNDNLKYSNDTGRPYGGLRGGDGDDYVDGGEGSDDLFGDEGNDHMVGGPGRVGDDLDGGSGDDKLGGDAGQDSLTGARGRDRLYGGDGNDHIYTGYFYYPNGPSEPYLANDGVRDYVRCGPGYDKVYAEDRGIDVIASDCEYVASAAYYNEISNF